MSFTLFSSALLTMAFLLRFLFCFVSFFVRIWFLNAFLRLILPVPVTLNRFFAPDFVFNFGITIILNRVPFKFLISDFQFLIRNSYFFPFGASIMYIRFPSSFGICSTLPHSSKACANFNSKISPRSLYTIDLPAK